MKRLLAVLAVSALAFIGGCGVIEDGEAGLRIDWNGKVHSQTEHGFYTAWTSSMSKFTVKEASLELDNLKPKAKDNLTLQDMDVSVFYQVNPSAIPALYLKYKGQHNYHSGLYHAGEGVVGRQASSTIQSEVSHYDSLVIHTKRELLEAGIQENLQRVLDASDPSAFKVTKIVIRSVITDGSIEESIRAAVQAQKNLEQRTTAIEIAKAEAKIEIAKAEGIREAQRIINATLTREYLVHEQNLAMMELAKKGGNSTIMFPYGSQTNVLMNVGK